MKALLFILGCVALSEANYRVVRSVHDAIVSRVKRQQVPPGFANGDTQGAFGCVQRCQPLLEEMAGDSEGADPLANLESLLGQNDGEYDPEKFPKLCDAFKDAKACFADCPAHPMITMVTSAFRPLEYMCVEKYDEFLKYQECLHDAKPGSEEQCEEKCGSEEEMKGVMRNLGQMEGQRDFADMAKALGQLCAFTDCHMICGQPSIVEACGSDEPVKLLRGLIGETMSMMTDVFSTFGLNDIVPQECKILAEGGSMQTEVTMVGAEPTPEGEPRATTPKDIGNEVTTKATTERPNDTKTSTLAPMNTIDENNAETMRVHGNSGVTTIASLVVVTFVALFVM